MFSNRACALLLCSAWLLTGLYAAQPKRKADRNSFGAAVGLSYAVPTGRLLVSDLSVYGRQGDRSLEGFKYTNAWQHYESLSWFHAIGRRQRFAVELGVQTYLRSYTLAGDYTFPNDPVRVTRREVTSLDIETPLGFLWRTEHVYVSMGTRLRWHYHLTDAAYDGSNRIEIIGEDSD